MCSRQWSVDRGQGETQGLRFAKQRLARRIPKRRLGTTGLGLGRGAKQSFAGTHSQAELGNDRVRGAKRRFSGRIPKRRLGTTGLRQGWGWGEGRSGASRDAFPSGAWERQGYDRVGAWFFYPSGGEEAVRGRLRLTQKTPANAKAAPVRKLPVSSSPNSSTPPATPKIGVRT